MNDRYIFPKARLLIFAKAPVPGQVKTRLAGCLGARGAARLYQLLLHRTLAMACAARLCPVELWCAPDARHGFFIACRRNYGVRLRRQTSGDLGKRMANAFQRTLAESVNVVLIGGDCASVNPAELLTAFTHLAAGHEAVLGPAADGGYVLIGLRRACPPLFRDIVWSTSTVLSITRQRLVRAGIDSVELAIGWDVDTRADLCRLRRLIPPAFGIPYPLIGKKIGITNL